MADRIQLSDLVWVKPEGRSEFDIPIAVKILNSSGDRIQVRDDDGKVYSTSMNNVLKPLHSTSTTGVEDMITLGELQEYTILRNLHIRYNQQLIYTYTGTMLIAINPYEILPIYTMDQIHFYQDHNVGDVPPHIFAIGDNSYKELVDTNSNQCIVISGESGAGKTESTKLLLQYLAAASGKHSWIEQQIQETNPILEAFGNAKTVRNDNSSRFGKYINIYFNQKGAIEGANIEQYLLEKSRIVVQNKGERNYHIFYSLVNGLNVEEKRKLELGQPADYIYLNSGNTLTCDGRNDVMEFADIRSAFKVLNFPDDEVWGIFSLLAAILHLGNLKFKTFNFNNIDSSEVADSLNANRIAALLGVNKTTLCDALTRKTLIVHGEKVISTITVASATDGRDALVKSIYGHVFVYIVEMINKTLHKDQRLSSGSIGILDIFGFENFDSNSFEQLCINYANENLQQFFVRHIFKLEQEQYEKEGISWTNINYVDNQQNLDVIGLKPMNLLSLIDEESKFPKGTDVTLLAKLHNNHSNKPCYITPKSTHEHKFGVRHFAGDVYYEVHGFLDKNRDLLTSDIKEMLLDSSNAYLKKLFSSESVPTQSSRKTVSLSHQFKTSLDALMKALYSCHPFFVRCIKPNEFKQPKLFDRALCVRQLRYAGLMETAKIRQAGFPIRYSYSEFVHRYRLIVPDIPPAEKTDCKSAAKKICNEVLNDQEFRLGHTKVFLKDSHDTILEELRHKVMMTSVIRVQANARRFIHRMRFLRLREAAIVVQKHFRSRGFRMRYLIMRRGYLRIQAVIRSRQLRKTFVNLRLFFGKLQAHCRGYLIRKLVNEKGSIIKAKLLEFKKERKELELSGKGTKAAEDHYENKVTELMKTIWFVKDMPIEVADQSNTVIDDKYVDDVFGFLKDSGASAGTIKGTGFGVTSKEKPPLSNVIPLPQPQDQEEQFDEFNFRKFAATYFPGNISHQYSRKPLKHSLLELPSPIDKMASQALWITILRFMGDLAEPKYVEDKVDNIPVMSKLTETVGRAFQKSKQFEDILANFDEEGGQRRKLIQKTLKKQTKLNEDLMKSLVQDEITNEMYSNWLNSRRSNNLEKLHFIIGHGIIRKELRDEIFCQLCKQLTNNPSKASHARGWILMSLCVGCFPPSNKFVKYLRSFIRDGPPGYAPYCEARLLRTFKHGPRTQPPSWLELQATKTKNPILLSVTLMDESTKTVQSDSATTAEEVCQQIADDIGLTDVFGFSLYITLFDKVLSLGNEGEHIMDAISQCEQFAKEQGTAEKNAPWRLFYRKEVFTPWHNPTDDSVATNLIYHQIAKGVKFGEYRCDSEKDLAIIAAQQHYIEYGSRLDPNVLRKVIVNYIPNHFIHSNEAALTKWEHFIIKSFETSQSIQSKIEPQRCKEDIVIFAKIKWPMLFSKFFEAIKIKGDVINKDLIIIAVNWTGIYIVDQLEHILLEIAFSEVTYVGYNEDKEIEKLGTVTIKTIHQEEFVFQSVDAREMSTLVIYLIDGLKRRSVYVIAQSDSQGYSDASSFLQYKKGDLITLLQDCNGETLMNSTWGHGECNRVEGLFPSEQVYIVPTLTRPSDTILEVFKKGRIHDDQKTYSKYSTIQRKRMHTLEKYAQEYFRENYDINTTISRHSTLTPAKKTIAGDLWAHSREPIKKPLLRKLENDEMFTKHAVTAFHGVLKYMGDMPSPKARSVNEYTDEIFKAAVLEPRLRDEIYCQIMKQLTNNRIQLSEERGWELMWLLTGVFACGQILMKELVEFLKTRPHPIAKECLKRVFKIQKGGSRMYAPYVVEVEAIQHRSMQIYHKVYFPDDTDEAFEVDSSTKARDLCEQITGRLNLKNSDGFSLFVKIIDKVFSVPENYYFFDFIYELVEWMKQTRPARGAGGQLQMNYQIFFMKKLWINTVPGKDRYADQIFYYSQELPKYLRGYHKTSKQDLIELAALVCRARFGKDQSFLLQITQMLEELLPSDMISLQSSSQWKSTITQAYNKQENMTESEAKEQFLKKIYQLPTFGTAFFEVKQSSDPSYPELVIIGINKNGVSVIHPQSRDVLVTHPFSQLSNWSSGNTFFHMTMGSFVRGKKILCETSLGYKMDDLISSYIAVLRQNMKQ